MLKKSVLCHVWWCHWLSGNADVVHDFPWVRPMQVFLPKIDTNWSRFYLSSWTAPFVISYKLCMLRKWIRYISSYLLGKEEWWHLFHLLKQHYKKSCRLVMFGDRCLFHLLQCFSSKESIFKFSITGDILAHKNILLNATILKSSIYSVFVKFVVYLLFHPENISSKVDVIENAN